MVQPPDVTALMEQDVSPLLLRQGGGQVDLRPNQTQYKGGVDVVRQVHTLFQGHRSHQPAAQPNQGHHAPDRHGGRARHPDHGGNGHGRLQGIGHRLLLSLRQSVRDGLANAGDRQVHRGGRVMDHVPGHVRRRAGVRRHLRHRRVQQPHQGNVRRQ